MGKLGEPEELLVCYEAGPTGYVIQRQLEIEQVGHRGGALASGDVGIDWMATEGEDTSLTWMRRLANQPQFHVQPCYLSS